MGLRHLVLDDLKRKFLHSWNDSRDSVSKYNVESLVSTLEGHFEEMKRLYAVYKEPVSIGRVHGRKIKSAYRSAIRKQQGDGHLDLRALKIKDPEKYKESLEKFRDVILNR